MCLQSLCILHWFRAWFLCGCVSLLHSSGNGYHSSLCAPLLRCIHRLHGIACYAGNRARNPSQYKVSSTRADFLFGAVSWGRNTWMMTTLYIQPAFCAEVLTLASCVTLGWLFVHPWLPRLSICDRGMVEASGVCPCVDGWIDAPHAWDNWIWPTGTCKCGLLVLVPIHRPGI